MFITCDLIGTCIVPLAVYRNAHTVFADVVLGGDAAIEYHGITCIFTISRHHDASGIIVRTFCVLIALDGIRAII
ncbi:hypothetical protein A3C37_00095 [Candidatus Peribacteria bacterium RIFCSPHIGHO2_02_FULL_53_20]|nr:MAG: hypothetical protein A3C37_00095 [Candidatus Peribacteria bacterium RIFCSPHIGHO2_02_FULL_53_20]OGJ73651.1 MAG: hypothetical protein A3G69_05555 [Candidatus Peribacteria bacterium RIFCSPLOWO2_12_FULL_53_10]